MKPNQLVLLGISSLLASAVSVSAYTAVSANPSSDAVRPAASSTKTHAVLAQNQRVAIASG